MVIHTEKKIKNHVINLLVMKLLKTNLKELRRKFGLIKRAFGRIKQVLLILSQIKESLAGRIWVY